MCAIALCIEIGQLCQAQEQHEWARFFMTCAEELKEYDPKDVSRKIKAVYGGMGSFNDLVLHREGKMVYADNEKLGKLRHQLFDEIVLILYGIDISKG